MPALNDWNTRMAPTHGLQPIAVAMGEQGFDVHTIVVELDNGGWSVEMQYTDEHMQDGMKEFKLDSSGMVLPV